MYWLQQKENLKKAEQYGFSKNHLKCKDIGHIWVPQFDVPEWDMRYFCFNCGEENKTKKRHIYKLPLSVPYRLYGSYGAE